MVRILYLPPYYETKFEKALERLIPEEKEIEYQIFTVDTKFLTNDLNGLLSTCRRIIQGERIQILISDDYVGQLLVAKLVEEYPKLCGSGMNFVQTLHCLDRSLMNDLFSDEHCLPTLRIDLTKDRQSHFEAMKLFLSNEKIDGYAKSLYHFDYQMASFRFCNWKYYEEIIDTYTDLYQQQHTSNLLPLFRVYMSKEQYSSIFQPSFIIQPFLDLVKYPHWRLAIASACIYKKEILMWPLVDGYCGWPFLAEKPLAILPILLCPSRQLTSIQQTLLYNRFREHLNQLISKNHLRYGWIECAYIISSTNEIRLISIKPTYSVYLTEAFRITSLHGHPIHALVQIANHQRPETPILNGKTVYIHRLWTNTTEKYSINDLINTNELKRIDRSSICLKRQVRLRFEADELLHNMHKQIFFDIGFIQTEGKYYEKGLTDLLEFRDCLLKKPELFPFIYCPSITDNRLPFDSITCLPSKELLSQLNQLQEQEQKDLI